MDWLSLISDMVAVLAGLVALAAVAVSFRRPSARVWQSRAFPLLLIGALITRAAAETMAAPLPREATILLARLLFLASASLFWPVLRQFAAPSGQAVLQARSQLRLAQAEASQSRHWLRLAEKIARVGHWRYSLAARRFSWSEEVLSIFALTAHDLYPDFESFVALMSQADANRARAIFEFVARDGAPFEFTFALKTPDGSTRHITARGVPEFDHAGNVAFIFGLFVDITAQKQVEDGLKHAQQASETANRVLETLALHDSLTRLPNRRHFDTTIAMEFKRAAREAHPVGLIMIDLDHFKSYNDQYGHPAGDVCLRVVAEAVAAVPQRPADMVARYGGEELVVLLPNTDLAGAETVADLLVKAVRALQIPHAGNPDGIVTISCGAAAFEPENHQHTPLRLIERADQALYKAKHAGRNRAVSEAMAA